MFWKRIAQNLKTASHKLLATTFVVVISLSVLSAPALATPEEDLEKVQKQLEEIRKQKEAVQKNIDSQKNLGNQYAQEIAVLKNKIDMLSTQISETELTIQELTLQIGILEQKIDETEEQIVLTEAEIEELQKEVDTQIVAMYMNDKSSSGTYQTFISSSEVDILKLELYHSAINDQLNKLVEELNEKQAQLDLKVKDMEEDKIAVERDKVTVDEQKIALVGDQTELNTQRNVLYAKKQQVDYQLALQRDDLNLLTLEEQKMQAEQRKIEQIIFDRINTIPSGTYVTQGEYIGQQGLTGYTTGYHLHFAVKVNNAYVNPCGQLPSGVFGNCGTAGGSLSWPMSGSMTFTSGYGWRGNSFHYGIDFANHIQNAPVKAAHDGWMFRGFEPCNSANPLCKAGGANYAIICENASNCAAGKKSMYWHLK